MTPRFFHALPRPYNFDDQPAPTIDNILWADGERKRQNNDFAGAIQDFTNLLGQINDNDSIAATYLHRGLAKFYLPDKEGFKVDIRSAIELSPMHADKFYTIKHIENLYRAIQDYSNIIDIHPLWPNAYFRRAECLYEEGKLKNLNPILSDLIRSLEIWTMTPELYNDMLQEAESFFEYVYNDQSERMANDFEGIGSESEINQIVNDLVGNLSTLKRRGTRWSLLYYWLGNIYLQFFNDSHQAINEYDRVLEIDPADPLAYYYRGKAKYNLGRFEGAREDFNRALDLDPESAFTYYGEEQ